MICTVAVNSCSITLEMFRTIFLDQKFPKLEKGSLQNWCGNTWDCLGCLVGYVYVVNYFMYEGAQMYNLASI